MSQAEEETRRTAGANNRTDIHKRKKYNAFPAAIAGCMFTQVSQVLFKVLEFFLLMPLTTAVHVSDSY